MELHKPYRELTNREPDFLVEYEFLSLEEGGRKILPQQGYRSNFWYPNDHSADNIQFMIYPEFLDKEGNVILEKGKSVDKKGSAYMFVLIEELRAKHVGHIVPGLEAYFMEGTRKVAKCTVTKILSLHD